MKIDNYVLARLDEDMQCDVRSPSESYVSHVTHVMISSSIVASCTSSLKHYALYRFRISVS